MKLCAFFKIGKRYFRLVIFCFILSGFHSDNIMSQINDNAVCGNTTYPWINPANDSIPFYLREGFGAERELKVAVIYVDFPDGRVNGTEQVFTQNELSILLSQGRNVDAVAELGVDSIGGTRNLKPAKYTYFDRWEMFFSEGTYNGSVHPDYDVFGDLAFGSMKEYFKEVTNEKINIQPALTHPNATGDPRRKTGIVNRDTVINGKHIIKSILLDRNKYGSNSYLINDLNGNVRDSIPKIGIDAISKVNYLYSIGQLDIQLSDFNGQILVIFAGGSCCIGGVASNTFTTNRGTTYNFKNNLGSPENQINRMDGFRIPVHEIGHNPPFNFFHTNSGRYCAMNPNSSAMNRDCPAHYNPIFKIQKGWVNPIAYEHSQQVNDLPPIESSYQCGIVTIYGKPSASLDWQTGEYFIVENRRLINFDRKINDHPNFINFQTFKGGLLIWHFSQFTGVQGNLCGEYGEFKLELPEEINTNLCFNNGSPFHFYGYFPIDPVPPIFRNLDTNRTHSGASFRTGIKIADITQQQTTNSGVSFNLQYKISEPPQYSYVIYDRNDPNTKIDLTDTVYYHKFDLESYFNIQPGTVIETGYNLIEMSGAEAPGLPGNLIKFRGAGYSNSNEIRRVSYTGIRVNGLTYSTVDSLILKNILLENSNPFSYDVTTNASQGISVTLANISKGTSVHSMFHGGGTISELNLSNVNFTFSFSDIVFNGTAYFNYSEIIYHSKGYFAGTGFDLNNSNVIIDEEHGNLPLFDKAPGWEGWDGIIINNGTAAISNATIRNASLGLVLSHPPGTCRIENSIFENNSFKDISLFDNTESYSEIEIENNTFICPSNQYGSIESSEIYNLNVINNYFTNVSFAGLILNNNIEPMIKGNEFIGSDDLNFSCGIFSESSNGSYECNLIRNFNDYGIFLINSQPSLYNNHIYENAYGMYLTNGSNPILGPSHLSSMTFHEAGLNIIEYNSNEEIFCNNDLNPSIPYLYKGENVIQDNENPPTLNYLISNESSNDIVIEAQVNYWGGAEPLNRFNPPGSVIYDDWLTSYPGMEECIIYSESADNSSMSPSKLMFGSANFDKFNGEYTSSIQKYKNIISNSDSLFNPFLALNNIFTANSKMNGDFNELKNYYSNQAPLYLIDSASKRRARELAIESKIELDELNQALTDYENIINTSPNELERFYASIYKQRVLRLLLNYQGDNNSFNVEEIISMAFKNELSSGENLNFRIKEDRNTRSGITKASDRASIQRTILNKRLEDLKMLTGYKKIHEVVQLITDFKVLNLVTVHQQKDFLPKQIGMSNNVINSSTTSYHLYQNYPNPFNPSTTIYYSITQEGFVWIKVYDILGKEVFLKSEFKQPGIHQIKFDGTNLSAGIYFYKLVTGDFQDTKRMILLK